MSLETPPQEPKRGPGKVWLPIVLMLGLIAGLALANYIQSLTVFPPVPPFLHNRIIDQLVTHTILSTVSIALLVALAVVYARVYWDTKGRFALGITMVAVCLLIQSIIQYPPFLVLFGPIDVSLGSPLSVADLLSIAAYSIFLYFSLD